MNKHQSEFVEVLKKHLDQEVSLAQMRTWLTENIKPIVFQAAGMMRPGLWLELRAYRTLRNHIDDLAESDISKEANLDWYWQEVETVIEWLVGHKIYKKSEYWLEYPLDHKRREQDHWMLPYLEYVEETLPILTLTKSSVKDDLLLPKSDLVFIPKPLILQTGAEIIMGQMLDIIENYEDLVRRPMRLPEHFHSMEVKISQLNRLEKLITCFKGETPYSVTAIFEGLDKFVITVFVL